MELLSSLVVLGLGLFLLYYSVSLGNEKKQGGIRRHKTDYDYDLVTYKNSIFIDVR